MMERYYKSIAISLLPIVVVYGVMVGCSKIDDFRKFETGGPVIYTGKPDSLRVLPGKNRVGIEVILNDPKVDQLRVFWSNHADSLKIPVQVVPGKVDTVYIDNLPEGVISFDVRTYDADGHSSVPANVTGTVYGNNYRKTLLNRGITVVDFKSVNNLEINWATPDTINMVTELFYTSTNGGLQKVPVSPNTVLTTIDDYDAAFPGYYRSYYKPTGSAIDTFGVSTTDSLSKATGDVTMAYLKNARSPFLPTPTSGSNRFRTLADWIVTPNVLNAPGSVGGWATDYGTSITMEAGWDGKAAIYNGKIYQTVTLPAGVYSFITSPLPQKAGIGSAKIYVAVALGNTLPDTDNVPSQALAFAPLYDERPVSFTLTQSATISLGFVSTIPDWTYLQWSVNVIKLLKQ